MGGNNKIPSPNRNNPPSNGGTRLGGGGGVNPNNNVANKRNYANLGRPDLNQNKPVQASPAKNVMPKPSP